MVWSTKLFLFLSCSLLVTASKYNIHEKATINFVDSRYFADVLFVTGQEFPDGPYHTNSSARTLVPMGNNLTLRAFFEPKNGSPIVLKYKACDWLQLKWVAEFIEAFADQKITCPILPGTYSFWNMELPPKNIPIPLTKGTYTLGAQYMLTDTEEVILDSSLTLHIFEKKSITKGH